MSQELSGGLSRHETVVGEQFRLQRSCDSLDIREQTRTLVIASLVKIHAVPVHERCGKDGAALGAVRLWNVCAVLHRWSAFF